MEKVGPFITWTSTLVFIFFVVSTKNIARAQEVDVSCAPASFGDSSIVCVCNSTYCDTINNVTKINEDAYVSITSTKSGLRFEKQIIPFNAKDFEGSGNLTLTLKRNQHRQKIFGFGAGFTDSVGINYFNLTNATRSHVLRSYYSPDDGIGYTYGRLAIGGTDFSTHLYAYDEGPEDLELKNFRLAEPDYKYKIPLLREAQSLMKRPIRLYATTWFAPGWIKEGGNISTHSAIKGKPGGMYYKAWAQYFVRFFQEYEKENITFWGLTPQNEPFSSNFVLDGLFIPFDPKNLSDFVSKDLGPALQEAGYGYLKLMLLDDMKAVSYQYASVAYAPISGAAPYISGMAIHDYEMMSVEAYVMLNAVHDLDPEKFILTTEYCEGIGDGVLLGNWERGESYSHKICESLRHWSVGWTDWNLLLNKAGGPSFINTVDASIIADADNDRILKQPMYYAIGHYSKFLHPGSTVIEVNASSSIEKFDYVAAVRPDSATVVVLTNRGNDCVNVTIKEDNIKIATEVPAHSIKTYIWWKK